MRSTLLLTILAGLTAAGCAKKTPEGTTPDVVTPDRVDRPDDVVPGADPGEWMEVSACVERPEGVEECAPAADVDPATLTVGGLCSSEVRELTGEGQLAPPPLMIQLEDAPPWCCYPAIGRDLTPNCAVGRPYVRDGVAQTAEARPGDGWCGPVAPAALEPELAAAWLSAALGEHASIGAFAQLTLQLLALGAPADLLADVQQAAADEVEHARLCFAQVRRFGGHAVEPGRFPVGGATLELDPAAVAAAAVREGCVGETVSAWLAERAAARATDPESHRVLTRIAADEARHAALSWRLVAWLMDAHGEDVRRAVLGALAEPAAVGPMLPGDESLAAFGAIPLEEHAALVEQARRDILEPAARVLLAA